MQLNSVNKNRDFSNPFSVHTFRISLFYYPFMKSSKRLKRVRARQIFVYFLYKYWRHHKLHTLNKRLLPNVTKLFDYP